MNAVRELPAQPDPAEGLTANAVLLLGIIAGALPAPYSAKSVSADCCTISVENLSTGNLYAVSVRQSGGRE